MKLFESIWKCKAWWDNIAVIFREMKPNLVWFYTHCLQMLVPGVLRTATRIQLLDNLALHWNKSFAWVAIDHRADDQLVDGLVPVLWWVVLDNEPALSNIVGITCNCLPRSSLCLCEAQGRDAEHTRTLDLILAKESSQNLRNTRKKLLFFFVHLYFYCPKHLTLKDLWDMPWLSWHVSTLPHVGPNFPLYK